MRKVHFNRMRRVAWMGLTLIVACSDSGEEGVGPGGDTSALDAGAISGDADQSDSGVLDLVTDAAEDGRDEEPADRGEDGPRDTSPDETREVDAGPDGLDAPPEDAAPDDSGGDFADADSGAADTVSEVVTQDDLDTQNGADDDVGEDVETDTAPGQDDTGSDGDGGDLAEDTAADPDVADDGVEEEEPEEEPEPTMVMWDLESAQTATSINLDFFDYPWPESVRYDADGTLDMSGFPNPGSASGCTLDLDDPVIEILLRAIGVKEYRDYVIDIADLSIEDFGNNSGIYFRFTGPIDESHLPEPLESLGPSSPVLLVNVDASSPRKGERVPVSVRMYHSSEYLHDNTMAILPFAGFPLQPDADYAAVVFRTLDDAAGELLGTPDPFEALKTDTPVTDQEVLYHAAFDLLEDMGYERDEIAAMSVFHTRAAIEQLAGVAADVEGVSDPASLGSLEVDSVTLVAAAGYYQVSGRYHTLIYQRGAPPYLPYIDILVDVIPANLILLLSPASYEVTLDPTDRSGELLSGDPPTVPGGEDAGAPRTEEILFELAIPADAIDDLAGTELVDLPLVLFAHGTGGSKDSPLGVGDDAALLAELGIATFSIDQVMHHGRSHSENIDPELRTKLEDLGEILGRDVVGALEEMVEGGSLFFNPLNLYAARGNVLQSAVDYIWMAELLTAAAIEVPVPGGDTISVSFDPAQVAFFGHSQGGLVGPFTAFSSVIDGLFLSAPGGHLISSLLYKTEPAQPFPISDVIAYMICEADQAENLDAHHPILSAIMTVFEDADGVNYARHIAFEPLTTGKHLFLTEGTEDHYTPPQANEAVSTAAHINQVAPELAEVAGQALLDALYEDDDSLDFSLVTSDLSGNVEVGDLTFTAGFKQYHDGAGECGDDHFVYRCIEGAVDDWTHYFETMLEGAAVISGP